MHSRIKMWIKDSSASSKVTKSWHVSGPTHNNRWVAAESRWFVVVTARLVNEMTSQGGIWATGAPGPTKQAFGPTEGFLRGSRADRRPPGPLKCPTHGHCSVSYKNISCQKIFSNRRALWHSVLRMDLKYLKILEFGKRIDTTTLNVELEPAGH